MNQRVAARYAQALFDMGRERGTLLVVSTDVGAIEETIQGSKELRAILASPVVKPEQKRAILREIFQHQISPDVMQFVDLLVAKGRAEELHAVTGEFKRMFDTLQNVVSAQITSALALSQVEQDAIINRLQSMSGKSVRASFMTDPTLLGGFIARMGDTLIDASLKHQLESLREQFKHGGSHLLN